MTYKEKKDEKVWGRSEGWLLKEGKDEKDEVEGYNDYYKKDEKGRERGRREEEKGGRRPDI